MGTAAKDRGDRAYLVSFVGITAVQSSHMVEHVAQVVQKYVFEMEQAHGLIGAFDIEWVHFVYDAVLILVTTYLFVVNGRRMRDASRAGYVIFAAGVAVQTWHMLEHVVKIQQHVETGLQMTRGILGYVFNLMLLHFWLNAFVTLALIVPFFLCGVHRRLVPALAKK